MSGNFTRNKDMQTMMPNWMVFCYFLTQVLVAVRACINGYWGEDCKIPCGIRCSEGCDNQNGRCFGGCMPGYWGEYCNLPCPQNCQWYCRDHYYDPFFISVQHILTQVTLGVDMCGQSCNTLSGECYRCEDKHFWGLACNNSCNINNKGCEVCDITAKCTECMPNAENTCQVDSTDCPKNCISCSGQVCTACVNGFWGVNCITKCPIENCLDSKCRKDNGDCIWGCEFGWWGTNCTDVCDSQNCMHCNRATGLCELCKNGFWGSNCESMCSVGCFDNRCEKLNGKCTPCKGMFWGNACNNSCFLENCDSIIDCTRDLGPTCFKCKMGKWGVRCSENCAENCTKGCHIGSGNCIDEQQTVAKICANVDNAMKETNITCPENCTKSSKNDSSNCILEQQNVSGICAKAANVTNEADVKLVVVVSVGCSLVVVIVVLLLAVVTVKIYWRRNQRKAKPDVTNLYQNTSGSTVHNSSAEIVSDVNADEISYLRKELEEITREEQRLKQKEAEELRRKLIEKKKAVAKLKGEQDIGVEFYEIPKHNIGDSSAEYESLRY